MFNIIVCLTCIESLACKTVYMNEHVSAVSFPDYFLVWVAEYGYECMSEHYNF